MKNVLRGLLLVGSVFSAAAVIEMTPVRTAFAQPPGVVDDHWSFHDGRWSYWNKADKRWYYTDGQHWFYHDGKVWAPYRFDRNFGRHFERGAYKHPAEGVTVTLPKHQVYVGP